MENESEKLPKERLSLGIGNGEKQPIQR